MSDDHQEPPPIDIKQMWAAMMPPSHPDLSFDSSNVDLQSITGWKKAYAIAVLAGLLTEPKYYANGIRLDWLLRLVITKSSGQKRPKPEEWSRVLNAGLEKAKVFRLAAGPYTQTLLDNRAKFALRKMEIVI